MFLSLMKKTATFIFLIMTSSMSYAENAYLVGDLGIIKPDLRGVLVAKEKSMPQPIFYHKAEPVYDRTKVSGDVVVSTEIEYDGVIQSKENSERAGFFSIVTSRDI